MHPTHWRRLLHGDWDISDPGEMFQPRVWIEPEHFVAMPVQPDARVRYWDLAASEPTASAPDPDYTVGFRMSRILDERRRALYVIEHVVRVRRTAGQIERLVHDTAESDGLGCSQWMEQEPGASGKSMVDYYRRHVMPTSIPVRGNPPRGTKGERARPWAGAMENGRCRVVAGDWNDDLFDELEAFSEDPSHSGAHDDQVDGGSGAFGKLARRLSSVSGGPVVPVGEIQR